jgi:MOSC domain-containing protein YiiM
MNELTAKIVSVHSGNNDDLSKEAHESIQVELDGIVDDRHRSYVRDTWKGDKQPFGTVRRNERQWSAVSVDELAAISEAMDLKKTITATSVGANLCIDGIPELSRLPKGTLLKFSSGAELIVEEFNPPCADMSKIQASLHETRSGEPISETAFSKAAKLSRGVVGVVEAAGVINAGDEVTVVLYETPSWLERSATVDE